MIQFTNVSKTYGGSSPALSQITVEIKDGEFVFLIGPSGAGKTTFLRLLIRDILPTDGDITVDEFVLKSLPSRKIHLLRRKIGTVFQDFKLLTDRTVFENVALVLDIHGKKDADVAKDTSDILALVGLQDKHTMFPLQLSAGELQRTAIARAIVGGPKILLADEPTGNLDPQTAQEIIEILQEINKTGTTVIMATHNVNIVNNFKKRTVMLEGGTIVSDEEHGQYRLASKRRSTFVSKEKEKHHENT